MIKELKILVDFRKCRIVRFNANYKMICNETKKVLPLKRDILYDTYNRHYYSTESEMFKSYIEFASK